MAGVSTEIQAEHIENMSAKHYRCVELLGPC
jgi:hypothetical protein